MESMVLTINKMEEKIISPNPKKPITGRQAADQMMFMFDLSHTLKTFLQLFPKASVMLFKRHILVRYGIPKALFIYYLLFKIMFKITLPHCH